MPTTTLTEDELESCKDAFAILDTTNNGSINADELRTLLMQLGQNPTDKELKAMITQVDSDGSGEIEYEEFLSIFETQKMANQKAAEEWEEFVKDGGEDKIMEDLNKFVISIRAKWALFDKEGKQKIDPAELGKALAACGQSLEEDDVTSLVQKVTRKAADAALEEGEEPPPPTEITFVCFLLCLGRLMTGKVDDMDMFTEEECMDAFKKFDRSSTGYISPAELMRTGGKHFTGGHMTIEDAKELVRHADVDKDGQINLDDFCIMMMMDSSEVFKCKSRGALVF